MVLPLPTARGASEGAVAVGVKRFGAAYAAWDRAGFEEAARLFGVACALAPGDGAPHYWCGVAEFHVALHLAGAGAAREAGGALGRAERALAGALERMPDDAESHALTATIYGMRIAEMPARAIWLGPRVVRHQRRASQCGAENPRVLYLLGMSRYHAPGFLGGRAAALESLLRAERAFEAETARARDPLAPRWGRGSCLTFLGKCLIEMGRRGEGETYLRRAASLEPPDRLALEELARLGIGGAGARPGG